MRIMNSNYWDLLLLCGVAQFGNRMLVHLESGFWSLLVQCILVAGSTCSWFLGRFCFKGMMVGLWWKVWRGVCSQLLYLVLAQFVSQSVLLSLSYPVFALNSLPRPWLVVSMEPPVQETSFLINCKEVINSALMGGKRFHSLKSDLNIVAILSGLVMARHWHFWRAINKSMTLLFEDHSLFALYDLPSLSRTISASVNLLTKREFGFKVHLHVFL
jgi:multidrug transporter EmrE-like cation transporter